MTRFLSAGLRQPWFDRVRLSPLPYLGSERCSCRHSSARASEARRFGNAQAITRCGEPMQLQLWVRIFAQNRTEDRAVAGPRAFNGLCDDEGVPLICPTCQVFAQSASVPATACYFAWGRFRYFRLGATATWRRDMLLEAAHSSEACSWSSATSKVAATRSRRARARTCSSCTMFQKRPDHRMAAV